MRDEQTGSGSLRSMLRPCLGIFALALLLRLIYLHEWRETHLFSVLLGDARGYDLWARHIAGGDWFGSEVFYQAPFYPYLLAVVYAVFGPDLSVLRSLQMVAGSVSCVLLALAGARFFSPRVGWVAGLTLALYAPALYYDGLIQKAAVGGLFMAGLLCLLGEFQIRPRPTPLVLAGALLGGYALTRENALLLGPLIGAWLLIRFRERSWSWRLRQAGLLAGGGLLLLLPVGLRNLSVAGDFLPTTGQLGTNFYIGNHAGATGGYVPLREGRGEPRYEATDARELAQAALGRPLGPREVSRYWLGQGIDWVRSAPGSWAALCARKAWLTWHARELIDFDALEAYRDHSHLLDALSRVLHFGVLAPLALAGAWITRREWERLWLLHAIVAGMAAGVVVFYVMGRYRYPLVPVLVLFAAAGIVETVRRWRAGERREPAIALALALLVSVPMNWPAGDDRDPRALTYYSLGVELKDAGRLDEAIFELERALRLEPRYVDAGLQLAHVRFRNGDPAAAAAAYAGVLEADPGRADAHAGLATIAESRGDAQGAYGHNLAALRLEPDHADAHSNLGNLLFLAGRTGEATGHYEQALASRPGDPEIGSNLGTAYLTLGRTEDALAAFRAALQADETSGPARFGEGMALQQIGLRRAAIRAFEQLDVASGASPAAYHVEARLRLARLYATCAEPDLRDPARAAELIDDVLRRRGDRDADVLLALAAIRAAGGFPREAAEAAERAGRLAASETVRRSALDRAELYRGGGALLEDCER